MPPAPRLVLRLLVAALLHLAIGQARILAAPGLSGAVDMIVLGDESSERGHAFSQTAGELIQGGLGEPARRLLPLDPVSHNGGSIRFTLKIDPERQNYVTVKLWGSDHGIEKGRLLLFMDDTLQVGYRHEGDHDVLNQTDHDPLYKDHFVYQTVALPLARTRGRTELPLKIAGLGRMWPYGVGFEQKQKPFTEPSRGIYRVYTHTDTCFRPDASEKQGAPLAPAIRPDGPGEGLLPKMKATVNERLARLMRDKAKPGPDPGKAAATVLLVAEAYHTPWTIAAGAPDAIAVLVQYGDCFLRPGAIGANWDGAGPLGEALARLGACPELERALNEKLEVPVNFPVLGKDKPAETEKRLTRREAWTAVLAASRDWNRTRGRRSYTNQSMIVDHNIYAANRGLAVIAPSRAMPEPQARRYLHEAVGLAPWLGNDTDDGAGQRPYGADYRLVTRKGLSRELGWVASYGETILVFCRDMAEFSGDPLLREQLIKLQAARAIFRYPSVDADGYRTMKLSAEIDNRVAHFPQPNGAYAVCDVREAWWMEVPAFAQDAVSVGAARQMLEDNQYFPRLAQRANDPDTRGMMRNIGDYERVKALPPVSRRLPMSLGEPDFIFSDEENAVLAIKHGDERLFVNFYFRQERGVSGVTRILEVTPARLHIASVLAGFEINDAGRVWTRPDVVDFLRSGGFRPPGEDIHQAWQGEKLPVAKRPPDAREPADGQWGPFVGKADFYHLRYGDYLIALNTTDDRRFALPSIMGFTRARDLASGKLVDLRDAPFVGPRSTRVLHLEPTASER